MDNTIDKNDVVINSRNYTMDIFKAIFAIGVITYDIVYLTDSAEWVYVWLAPALIIICSIIISIIIYEIKNLITKRKEAH